MQHGLDQCLNGVLCKYEPTTVLQSNGKCRCCCCRSFFCSSRYSVPYLCTWGSKVHCKDDTQGNTHPYLHRSWILPFVPVTRIQACPDTSRMVHIRRSPFSPGAASPRTTTQQSWNHPPSHPPWQKRNHRLFCPA